MHKSITDFLEREEKRRNRSFAKTFLHWLGSERGLDFQEKLLRVLNKKGSELEAVKLLKKAEENAKSDLIFKRSDNARKKAIKKFREAFEKWMKSEQGAAYRTDMEALFAREDLSEKARTQRIQDISDQAEQAFILAHPHLAPTSAPRPKSRIRNSRRAWSQSVDDVVYRVIEPGLKQLGFIGSDLLRNWTKVVGPAVARNSRPEKVYFAPKSRSHGKVLISVRHGFNTEILHQSDEIIRRINTYFGYQAVSDVQISKKPFDHFITPGQKSARAVISKTIPPQKTPSPHVEKLLDSITDPDLKSALHAWGRIMHGRNG